jgi:hypothetical protein
LEAVVFFFAADEDDFFLLDEVDELACGFGWSVVVCRADSPIAWTSKQKVRNRAKKRPK